MAASEISKTDLESFAQHLKDSKNVLALCGAGLSAASGLPTFRGAGGLWRKYDAMSLATPQAFNENPGLVWQFYNYRRHMALQAKPNAGHYALVELAKRKDNFHTLTQNVDGLSQRAGHPRSSLHLLHGSLFDLKCFSHQCDYIDKNNFTDPAFPALAAPGSTNPPPPLGTVSSGSEEAPAQETSEELDISDDRIEIPMLERNDIPTCPHCKVGLIRPAVVWFGEALPEQTLNEVEEFLDNAKTIDLVLVIGTSGQVMPAAGYVDDARQRGAKVAVINMDPSDRFGFGPDYEPADWFFQGDAAVILPQILQGEIGNISSATDNGR